VAARIFASLIIALSGMILFTDKVITFNLEDNYGFQDSQTFIWVLCQTLSPLVLILGAVFRPYKIAYLIPVYFYSIQMYWVFMPNIKFDDELLQVYAIGCCIAFAAIVITLNVIYSRMVKTRKAKESFLEECLDFSIELNQRKHEQ